MLCVHFQFHSLQLFLSFVNCLVYFILFPYAVSSGFGQAILSQRLFCPGCPGLSYSLSCRIFLFLFSQIGSVMQNFLMSFFALINVFAIFNSAGALFHSLIASPRKLAFALHKTPNSIHFPLEHPLVSLPFSGWVCLSPFTGYSTSFSIFHISVNFICAFVWFTDSILFLASILSMLTLSLILLFSTVLSILFCANCIPFICLVFHWSSVVLTLAQSWRPYLSLDVQILSTIFFSLGPLR